MPKEAVDFSNPEAIAAELAGASVAAPAAVKEKKPKVINVTFTADRDITAGEIVTFKYEVPKSEGVRGIVAGLSLDEMTDDQLKIEYRNASSVAYKTHKAGRDATKADARVNACKAEMEKRGIQPTARGAVALDAAGIANLIKSGAISIEDISKFLEEGAQA